jgi:beta-N-acetylhexosaminidase
MTMSPHGAAIAAATTVVAAVAVVAVVVAPSGVVRDAPAPRAATCAGATPAPTRAPAAASGDATSASATSAGATSDGAAGSAGPAQGATVTATTATTATASAPEAVASPSQAPAPRAVDAASVGAEGVLARMTRDQRIGQLFMVGTPATGADPATLAQITTYHVGNVMLRGRSSAGVAATATVSAALRRRVTVASTASVRLFVATDQEGGSVQVLRGAGFDAIPSALVQGTWSATALQTAANRWARQLRYAGVNLDLAPVLDTVPGVAAARLNPPIGVYRREFGYSPATVAAHGLAFVRGFADASVDVAVKHFPGLGRVSANTDTTAGVTDAITTRTDAYLAPFAVAIDAGAPFVMMSTAYYSRIDPAHPAAFSPTVIGGLLRNDLHFDGVVISDDIGNAAQVARWTPGSRAVQFLAAGGDMVLDVNPALLPAMVTAVRARAASDPAFARLVDAAALRVLRAKQARGLLPAATQTVPVPVPAPVQAPRGLTAASSSGSRPNATVAATARAAAPAASATASSATPSPTSTATCGDRTMGMAKAAVAASDTTAQPSPTSPARHPRPGSTLPNTLREVSGSGTGNHTLSSVEAARPIP